MKPIIVSATCALAAVTPAVGQDIDPDPFLIPNPNRLSLGARVSFNFKASFATVRSNPGTTMRGIDHNYDDGYVRVDISGNANGTTWNWGYERPHPPGTPTIDLHAIQSTSVPNAFEVSSDEAYYGMELVYQRLAATFGSGGGWGFEGAFSYSDFELGGSQAGSGTGTLLTDSFALNGVLPPQAPYHGSFEGPGALLDDTPTRTIGAAETVTFASDHRVSGQLFGFRFGPFIEWNFSRAFSVALSGGIALAPALIDYEFSEDITLQSGAFATNVRQRSTKTDLLYGNYISASVRYHFNEQWGIYAGAQFQTLSDFEHTVNDRASNSSRTARIESGSTVQAVAGVTFKF
jgi:hypothetical protein